jgi:hypothetical protein
MTIKERRMLITKHAKDLPQLREAAEEVGSCSVNEDLGWTKGYIAGLSLVKYKTQAEMRRKL